MWNKKFYLDNDHIPYLIYKVGLIALLRNTTLWQIIQQYKSTLKNQKSRCFQNFKQAINYRVFIERNNEIAWKHRASCCER